MFQKIVSALWVLYYQTLMHYWINNCKDFFTNIQKEENEDDVEGHCYATKIISEESSDIFCILHNISVYCNLWR